MDAMQIVMELGTPAGRADPYPRYAALHELGEAVRLGPGAVVVVGYDANNAVLRDPCFTASDGTTLDQTFPGWRSQPVFVQGADWLLNINGARHARIRRLIARAFTARRVAGLEPAITTMADELLAGMADRGADGSAVEFMHDFAYLLPVTVICELLGIPEADREGFRPVARDLAGVFEFDDPARLPAINAAAVELLAYFTGLTAQRRAMTSSATCSLSVMPTTGGSQTPSCCTTSPCCSSPGSRPQRTCWVTACTWSSSSQRSGSLSGRERCRSRHSSRRYSDTTRPSSSRPASGTTPRWAASRSSAAITS
jgi:cytochrome P450